MLKAHRRGPELHRVLARRGGNHRRVSEHCEGSALYAKPVFEALETRRLLHHDEGGFSAFINFQPAGASTPVGYHADTGAAYGVRSDGLTYGWSWDNSSYASERNSVESPDQRYDTLAHIPGSKRWEIAVPNGVYELHLVAGDAEYFNSDYQLAVEGKLALSGKPTSSNRWVESTYVVSVSDGKLTLNSAAGAYNNKISFIEVASLDGETSAASDDVVVTATSVPAAPSSFLATRISSSAIELTWKDNSSVETGVKIERKKGDSGTWAQVATVGANITRYTDTGLLSGTRYVYRVRAYNSAGNSGYSNTDGSTTLSGSSTGGSTPSSTGIAKITWSTRASSPVPMDDVMGVTANGKLYLLGGMGSSGPVRRSDRYDPVNNRWERLPDLPERLTHAQPVVDGQYIYLVGGYVGTGNGWEQVWATRHVWRFDTVNLKWSAMPSLPVARGGGAAAIVGRKIHFFGGVDVNRADKSDHFILDLANTGAGWKVASAMPNARSHHAAAVMNGKIYLIGGQKGYDGNATLQSSVNVYDPSTARWSTAASLPAPRSHIICSTFVLNGRIVAIGGDVYSPGNRSADVLAYNPSANVWSKVSSLPSARLAAVAGAIGGKIYVASGSNQTTTYMGIVS